MRFLAHTQNWITHGCLVCLACPLDVRRHFSLGYRHAFPRLVHRGARGLSLRGGLARPVDSRGETLGSCRPGHQWTVRGGAACGGGTGPADRSAVCNLVGTDGIHYLELLFFPAGCCAARQESARDRLTCLKAHRGFPGNGLNRLSPTSRMGYTVAKV